MGYSEGFEITQLNKEIALRSSDLHPSLRPTTLFLGVAGLIISWVAFGEYALEEGPDIVGFWSNALTQLGLKGLTYDLVACGAILSIWALGDIKRLGASRVAAICLTTWILGVCGGLALWALWFQEPA